MGHLNHIPFYLLHLGGAQKCIPVTVSCFWRNWSHRVLSCFLGVFLLTQLHSWMCSDRSLPSFLWDVYFELVFSAFTHAKTICSAFVTWFWPLGEAIVSWRRLLPCDVTWELKEESWLHAHCSGSHKQAAYFLWVCACHYHISPHSTLY